MENDPESGARDPGSPDSGEKTTQRETPGRGPRRPFPVPEKKPRDADQYDILLTKLEDHDHRTSAVKVAVSACKSLIDELKPEAFHRLGQTLVSVACDPENSTRVRIMAVQRAIDPLKIIAEGMLKRKRGGGNVIEQRAGELIEHFLDGIGLDGWKKLGAVANASMMGKCRDATTYIKVVSGFLSMLKNLLATAEAMELAFREGHSPAPVADFSQIRTVTATELDEIKRKAKDDGNGK